MSRLFIFTAVNKNARKHLNDSIENPIGQSIIKSHLDNIKMISLKLKMEIIMHGEQFQVKKIMQLKN